jgi:hypothetical protein
VKFPTKTREQFIDAMIELLARTIANLCGASVQTLRKRVGYGGRKGRSAARRLRRDELGALLAPGSATMCLIEAHATMLVQTQSVAREVFLRSGFREGYDSWAARMNREPSLPVAQVPQLEGADLDNLGDIVGIPREGESYTEGS